MGRKPGLLRTGASPAELLLPRPAALDPPLEPDDDHDLLVLDPRLGPQHSSTEHEVRKRVHQEMNTAGTHPLELEPALPYPFLFLEYLKNGAFFLFRPCSG